MPKISKRKKILKVLKRKLLKPICYAILASLFMYVFISNIIIQKELKDLKKPHFVISRISKNFDNIEFMHLLLTVQEISKDKSIHDELVTFVNAGYPNYCPENLRHQLYLMNWAPQAFLVRVKKMFELQDIYDRLQRVEETIEFVNLEIKNDQFSSNLKMQLDILNTEREDIFRSKLSDKEYEFIKNFDGLIQQIRLTK